jgi:hypothetical protein
VGAAGEGFMPFALRGLSSKNEPEAGDERVSRCICFFLSSVFVFDMNILHLFEVIPEM